MEENDIYDLFTRTFGQIKNDDVSWQGFIKMIFEKGLIDDKVYTSLKQKNSVEKIQNIVEKHKINIIPKFENF